MEMVDCPRPSFTASLPICGLVCSTSSISALSPLMNAMGTPSLAAAMGAEC